MRFSILILILILIQAAHADCWNFEGHCIPSLTTSMKTEMLLQNKTVFYQGYADTRTIYYSDSMCTKVEKEVLAHTSYDATFCYSKVLSVWVRYTEPLSSSSKAVVESCGSSLTKGFVDIATLSCKVNGIDPFYLERLMVGTNQQRCVRFDDEGIPQIDNMDMSEKCDLNNDVGDSWITTVVILMAAALVLIVLIVMTVVFFVVRGTNRRRMRKATIKVTSTV